MVITPWAELLAMVSVFVFSSEISGISAASLQDEGLLSLVSDELDIRYTVLTLMGGDMGRRIVAEHRIVASGP